MNKKLIIPGLLILAGAAAVFLIPKTGRLTPTGVPVVIGFDSDVPTFDPLRMGNVYALRVGSQVFEGLTRLDESNHIVGALSDSWTHGPDYRTWTFHLRSGVRFHPYPALPENRRILTPEDVVYSFTRMLSKDSVPGGPLAAVLGGAKAFQDGKSPTVSGLRILSPSEIEFSLIRADAYFPGMISSPAYSILKKEVLDAAGTGFGQSVAVGTGPFQFVERRGNELVFRRYNEYWGKKSGIDAMVFRTVKEDVVRLAEAKAGRLNITYATPPMLDGLVEKKGESLEIKRSESGGMAIMSFPVFNSSFLAFNYPNVDPALRQAIALAVNRDEIVSAVVPITGLPAAGPIPLACADYKTHTNTTQDLQAAKASLKLFVQKHPGVAPKLQVLTADVAQAVPVGEVLQSQLRKIGVAVDLVQLSFNALLDRIQKGDFEAFTLSFEYQYSLPQLILDNFYTSPAVPLPNLFYYKKTENDAAIAALLGNGDERGSLEQAAAVEAKLVDDAPGVFLFQTRQVILLDPRLRGVQFNAANFPILDGASWR